MGHREGQGTLGWVGRSARGGALDREADSSEDQQVEIELARSPVLPSPTPEGALDGLERYQQRGRARRRIRAARDVDGDDRVVELRLVDDTHRGSGVQPRDPSQLRSRQSSQGVDGRREGTRHVSDIRAQPHICAGPTLGQGAPPR